MPDVLNPDAGPDEPLRITLEDEPPAQAGDGAAGGEPKPSPPPSAASPAAPPPPAVGIEDLARQLADTKRQREQAAQFAVRARQERDQAMAIAAEAQRRGISADEVVVGTRLAAAQQEVDSLKEALVAAYEAADYKKVADLQAKMNKAGGSLAVLEWQQNTLAGQRQQFIAMQQQQAAAQQQQAAAAARVPSDPIEAFIGTRSPPTAQFMRTHKDKLFRPDGSLKRVAIEAHEAALDEGLGIDTDGYFRRVEELIGGGAPPQPAEQRTRQVKDNAARPKGAPTTAAPVSRGGPTAGGGGGTEYVMTPYMRQLAHEQMGDSSLESEVEWFRNYQKMVREGRMEPITQ